MRSLGSQLSLLLSRFGLSEVPTIKFFGDKIMNDHELGDDEFCMCFGVVVLCALICPNSSAKPSTKYMGALVDTDNIINRNWSKFVLDWMMCYIRKYQKERAKNNKMSITLGGCIYQQAVRYLDFIDLGPIKLPSTIPRIRVWKGDLINHFSQIDKGKDGNYGSHVVKDMSQTCYARPINAKIQKESGHHQFMNDINRCAGDYISKEVKNQIFDAFQSHMIDADSKTYTRAQLLVMDLLNIIVSEGVSKLSSETTVLITQDSIKESDEAHKPKK
ncbi:unnamed protein product [Alopecurus aequalis]